MSKQILLDWIRAERAYKEASADLEIANKNEAEARQAEHSARCRLSTLANGSYEESFYSVYENDVDIVNNVCVRHHGQYVSARLIEFKAV